MQFVTLPEARADLNMMSAVSDDELIDKIEAAEAAVLRITGPTTTAGVTVVETVYPYRGVARLASAPVTSITSVTGLSGSAVTYTADLPAGLLYVAADWTLTVTYVSGDSTDPLLMREAVLMVTRRLWETQRGNAPAVLQGGEPTFTPGLQGILADVRALLGIASRPAVA